MIAISFVMCYICACHTHSNSKCVNLKWCGQLLCLLPATAREVWRCHLNLDMLRLTFFWPKHNILLIATAQLNWLPKHCLIRTDESSGRHRRGSFTKHQACKFQHLEFLLPVHIPNPCVCGPNWQLFPDARSPGTIETMLCCLYNVHSSCIHAKQCNKNCNSQS